MPGSPRPHPESRGRPTARAPRLQAIAATSIAVVVVFAALYVLVLRDVFTMRQVVNSMSSCQ